MKRVPRVVLDTNVVLSALVFRGGRLAAIRSAWQSGLIQPLVIRATAEELVRVLGYPKFRLGIEEREHLLADYLPFCNVVTLPRRASRAPACPDPDDLPFLQLAVAGKAEFLITGDKALLGLDRPASFEIVTPSRLVKELEKR